MVITSCCEICQLNQGNEHHQRVRNATYHEASIDTNSQTETHEHECHLVARSKSTGPEAQERPGTVKYRQSQRDLEDVEVREIRLDKVSHDHPANSIGVDQANIQDKCNQVVFQDSWL